MGCGNLYRSTNWTESLKAASWNEKSYREGLTGMEDGITSGSGLPRY